MRYSKTLDVWLSNLSKAGRSRKQAVAIAVDASLVVLSLWLAYSLRYGAVFNDFKATWHLFLVLPVVTVVIFMALNVYRWVVRSSNQSLINKLIKGCIASSLFLVLVAFLFPPDASNPRSLFVIYGMLLVIGTSGVRSLWKMLFDYGNRGEPIAIYGAGEAGRQLLNALSKGSEYRPVLFLDDDPAFAGTTIGGLSVIPGISKQAEVALHSQEVERVILAMPSINATEYQGKAEAISALGFKVQTIPSYAELVDDTADVAEIRDISISDILGRSEVPPIPELLGECIKNKSVLVTGGGGSIGSELCRQIIAQDPSSLILVDQSEENLYMITEELNAVIASKRNSSMVFVPILASVTDRKRMLELVAKFHIDTVYHAAAYKHVPIVEQFPEQGVNVNVFGTLNVLDAAIASGVENFTLISTDKAVRPTNAMGATKRIAELILQAKARQANVSTRISMVRFGNVLGSSGSVVPKFLKQIEANGPITITDPDITRYFMTIPEAAQLVLQASSIAKGGDVFVLDMGEPVRIEDLAVSMVRLAGKKLQRDTGNANDIEIKVLGLRPGEKMFEELFLSQNFERTVVSKVFAAKEDWIEWTNLEKHLQSIQQTALDGSSKDLKAILLAMAFLKISEVRSDESTVTKDRSVAEAELVTPAGEIA